ncbi:DNA replication/repair protein RecF [Vulcaniibacterium gelatinicum]|uniref:DNA replication/repair protein RecF n=1 Tax=Vulcaniibacterium gelatinicum TaxID=2598725 RepID=UPI0011CCD09B|nr:DNA replication/repair protein RecF [Vulcaniibacterium gelatinicum]
MHVTRLDLHHLRRFEAASLAPHPGLNLITGDNGTGKTSLLEALHLLAYGRSFRGRVRDGLIRAGSPALELYVEWQDGAAQTAPSLPPRTHRAGLRHAGGSWTARLDGRDVGHLGELCAALAVVTFEPGSHALVNGGSEPRRRLLDWGLFHVEPDFLGLWRRCARALKQRNQLLKGRAEPAELEAWEHELATTGEALTRARERYLEQLAPHLAQMAALLLPAGGEARLEFQPGWRREELPLADALLLARERDLALGHTSVGPHRADWQIRYTGLPGREGLSRGQAKLTALSLLLAQAECHAGLRGDWPVILLDDLASELDRRHQAGVLAWLIASGAQVIVTGTEPPPGWAALGTPTARFHVEQGRVVAG